MSLRRFFCWLVGHGYIEMSRSFNGSDVLLRCVHCGHEQFIPRNSKYYTGKSGPQG